MRKHECAENLDQFAAFGGQDGSAEDAVVRSVDYDFHQPGGFAALNGAGDIRHRTFPDFQFVAFRTRFFFRHADTAELGIGEQTVRHEAIVNREIFSFHEIAVNNLEIVVGNVRESGAAFAIAERPNSRDGGLEAAVYLDEAIFVRDDAGLVETELAGVWTTSSGDQEMGTSDARGACRACVGNGNGAGFTFSTRGARVENELNSLGFECFLELGGDFGIFTLNNLRALMQDGDAAAEPAKHLSKFEADVTASENQEMLGNGGEPHDGFVGEIGNGFEAENHRDTRAATGVDENPFAFEGILADLELMRRNETRVAAMKAKFGALVYLFLLAATKTQDDFVFLGDDFGQIDADVGGVDAPARGVPCVVSDLRAMNHRFGRRATDVDAGAPKIFFFDQRHGPSEIGETMREGITALA